MGIFSGLFRSRDKPKDSYDSPSYIAREFARRIGAKEEEAFFIGNGNYIMAKHADPENVPDNPDEWLEAFNTFSIYEVLPQLIELWGLNVETQAESKKNIVKLTAR